MGGPLYDKERQPYWFDLGPVNLHVARHGDQGPSKLRSFIHAVDRYIIIETAREI